MARGDFHISGNWNIDSLLFEDVAPVDSQIVSTAKLCVAERPVCVCVAATKSVKLEIDNAIMIPVVICDDPVLGSRSLVRNATREKHDQRNQSETAHTI